MDKYKASCYHAKFWIRLLNALYLEDQCFTYFFGIMFGNRKFIFIRLSGKYQFNHYNALSSISCKLQNRTIHHETHKIVSTYLLKF